MAIPKLTKTHVLFVLWVGAVSAGLYVMERYSFTPAAAGVAPERWTNVNELPTTAGKPTLIMFAYPKCPCTRASIGELARIMSRCQDRTEAFVVFLKYDGATAGWEKTDLWTVASTIPGVQFVCDEKFELARRFGARSSGETLLYDSEGVLVFHGGITSSRGHYGDNAGHSAIVSLLTDGSADQVSTSVFGCSLENPSAMCVEDLP